MIICVFAFALRLIVMFAAHTYRNVNDDTDHFGFGWEMGRVARSLAEGHGFASPLPLPTGPTAIVGPGYPIILAGVFKVFGVYSTSSAIVIRVIQSAFSSLTCFLIFLCGRDTVGEDSGKLAALLWALFPLNIFFTVLKVWETSLTALLMVALFWCFLRLLGSLSVWRWAAAGVLLGIAVLVSTSLVILVVPFGIAALWQYRIRVLRPAAIGILICGTVVSPWVVRNYLDFRKPMLRSNFPLEFRIGNNDWSYGQKIEALHPSNNPAVNRHWQDVGELRFMAEESAENSQFVAHHFERFAFSTFNRIVNYWTGAWLKPIEGYPNSWGVILPTTLLSLSGFLGLMMMWRSHPIATLMGAGCVLVYPVAYYLTTTQPRFYHAVTPLLILSLAFFLLESLKRLGVLETSDSRIAAASAAELCRSHAETL